MFKKLCCNLFGKTKTKKNQLQKLYVIHRPTYLTSYFNIHEFYPCVKKSYGDKVLDNRPVEEILASNRVNGVIEIDGYKHMISVSGSEIYISKETAQIEVDRLNKKIEEKKMIKFYVIHRYKNVGQKGFNVEQFYPGTKDENSMVDRAKGNWFTVIPDERSTTELLAADKVEGLICLEGGNYMMTVKGSEIYTDKSKAEADAQYDWSVVNLV